jgi:hypothetical protein
MSFEKVDLLPLLRDLPMRVNTAVASLSQRLQIPSFENQTILLQYGAIHFLNSIFTPQSILEWT